MNVLIYSKLVKYLTSAKTLLQATMFKMSTPTQQQQVQGVTETAFRSY